MKNMYMLLMMLPLPFFAAMAQPAWIRHDLRSVDTVFYGVAFTDTDKGFVVGTDGVIYGTTDGGVTWAQKSSPTRQRLNRIHFLNPNTGFITGDSGTLLKSSDAGASWKSMKTDIKQALFDVFFFDEDSGFVAGQAGALLYTNDKGNTWRSRDAQFGGNNIYSITFPTKRYGYACGNVGNISRTTNGGRTWQSQQVNTVKGLYSISFGSQDIGTAVGDGGEIYHTTNAGRNWNRQDSNVPLSMYPLYEVQHIDTNLAYATGWFGIFLRKTPADPMWIALPNPYGDPLECMQFVNDKTGYAVGWYSTVLKTTSGGVTVPADEAPEPIPSSILYRAFPIRYREVFPVRRAFRSTSTNLRARRSK